ncbi:TniQ family protein [Agrobacterium rhizogenes]|nr:TniQ family protein [Rhizobium rhizogenes]
MSGLFAIPALREEPLTSFLSRFARANGASTSRKFCLHMGLDISALNRGDESEVGRLAVLAQLPLDELVTSAVRVDEDRGATIGDSYYSKLMLRRSRLRFCPHCILDDDNDVRFMPAARRRARTYWMFPQIAACLSHSRRLVEIEDTRFDRHRYDLITQLEIIQDRMPEMMEQSTREPVLAFEHYVHDRLLDIKAHGAFLDSASLAAGMVACELLGVAEVYGRDASSRSKSEKQMAYAREAGFQSLSKGFEGFHKILDGIMSDDPRRSTRGGKVLYGGLYSALDQAYEHPQYDVLRRTIREYTLQKVPILDGSTFFGPVTDSPWTSVAAIVRVTGHSDQTVRRLLVDLGHLETLRKPKDAIFIRKNVADEVIDRFENTATLEETSKMLGLTSSVVRRLIDAGFLSATSGKESIPARGFKMNDRYPKASITSLRARALGEFGSTVDAAWLPIGAVAKRCNLRVIDVLDLVLKKHLANVGLSADGEGIGALRFDREEIDALQQAPAGSLLGRVEVCRKLKIGSDTFALLVKQGILASTKVRLRAGRSLSYMVEEDAVRDFDSRFASFSRLTEETGITGKSLGIRLRRENVCMAFSGQTRDRVVERSTLPKWVKHSHRVL